MIILRSQIFLFEKIFLAFIRYKKPQITQYPRLVDEILVNSVTLTDFLRAGFLVSN